ncbi:helicase-related protein [Emcibacter sp.]|uniref:helicase-related protein n=1 Tax=Emcibacter sp. TaxID=1979954 RepID=UPI002AA86B99|nr:helicase-related protein [Emcibacter sp.]
MKNLSNRAVESRSHVKAVLGPTNTGKTHLAVERMLGHSTGMIGLPLRLLAREIYDRIVKSPQNPAGRNAVALITGEEKIIPKNPRWYVCTVESMPLEIEVSFLAVDEIQLAADMDRGHIFTDRLLRARGREETMFLGSATMASLIRQLIPDVEFITRRRFSTLSYVMPKKLSRLPRRSALVAFSAENVYGYAEMIRRQKGGAAVVMGALSPRTRNAQVELYQNGDVDYLVATDAIGMGLNMDIDHVCFAATSKFDGRRMRDLTPAELGQIAGRAGRHMNNGTFGVLTEGADYERGLSDDMVHAIENHDFAPDIVLQWRNSLLDFAGPGALIRSLEAAPGRKGLTRALESTDLATLRRLAGQDDIRALAAGPASLKLLWEICQIPDFRKTSDDEHIRLAGQIFRQISSDYGVIAHDWMARQVEHLNRTDGGIDALSARIAHIRTWTYISHRSAWLDRAKHWQEVTRDIEDRLSDALHERLTQRFVDRRTSVLMRELRQKGRLMANIDTDGSVFVESHFIGTLEGFQFREDPGAYGEDSKTLRHAADKVLAEEIANRARELDEAGEGELSLIFGNPLTQSTINWRGVPIARVVKGGDVLSPKASVIPTPVLQGDSLALVQKAVDRWLQNHVEEVLAPLFVLKEAVDGATDDEGKPLIDGLARGIAFQMVEKLGTIPRRLIARDFKQVDRDGRFQIKKLGVWLGAASLYIPAVLKPAPAQLRLFLWALFNDMDSLPVMPPAGLCTIKIDQSAPRTFYEVSGYRVTGKNGVRLDMLERLANAAREVSMKGPFPSNPDLMSLVGVSGEDFEEIMKYLGYVTKEFSPEEAAEIERKRQAKEFAELAAKAEAARKDKTAEVPAESSEEPVSAEEELTRDRELKEPAPVMEVQPEAEQPVTETEVAETEVVVIEAAEEAAEGVVAPAAEPEEVETGEKAPAEEEKAEDAEPEKYIYFIHRPEVAKGGPRHQERHRERRHDRNGPGPKGAKGDGRKHGGGKPGRSGGPKGPKVMSASVPRRKAAAIDPDSPFAALADLKKSLARKK